MFANQIPLSGWMMMVGVVNSQSAMTTILFVWAMARRLPLRSAHHL